MAGLAFMLIAVQLFPTLALRPYVTKPSDIGFNGTQPPVVTLFDLVMPDRRFWVRGVLDALGPELHYSYVGATLFCFVLFLVPAFLRYPNRDVPPLALGFILAVAWASARHTFMFEVWKRWEGMQLISFHALAMAVATVLLIPLALWGAEYLWRQLAAAEATLRRAGPQLLWRALGETVFGGEAGAHAVAEGGAVWSVSLLHVTLAVPLLWLLWNTASDPWLTNRHLWSVAAYNIGGLDEVYDWLKGHDSTAYSVAGYEVSLSVGVASVAQVKHEIQVLSSPWRLELVPQRTPRLPNGGLFTAAPKYLIARRDGPKPPGATLLTQLPGGEVYEAAPGLPFAFVADPNRLPYGGPETGAAASASGSITPAAARFLDPNHLQVRVPASLSPERTSLVVMQSYIGGWRAVDASGQARTVTMDGGFLSLRGVRSGEELTLSYFPASFVVGGLTSAAAVLGLLGLVWQDMRRRPSGGTPGLRWPVGAHRRLRRG